MKFSDSTWDDLRASPHFYDFFSRFSARSPQPIFTLFFHLIIASFVPSLSPSIQPFLYRFYTRPFNPFFPGAQAAALARTADTPPPASGAATSTCPLSSYRLKKSIKFPAKKTLPTGSSSYFSLRNSSPIPIVNRSFTKRIALLDTTS